jgi:serine/threonine protein phosphatase PrpC
MGEETWLVQGDEPVSHASALWLVGRDYPALGPVALATHPKGGALGISRGRLPKPYAHVEPNEDAALLVHTDGGVLLAVTDGFNGADASILVLEAVRDSADALVVADPRMFEKETGALMERIVPRVRALAPADTTLVTMAVYGESVHVASFGDSIAFSASHPEPLVPPDDFWLARNAHGRLGLEPHLAHFCRKGNERIAVVSDGIANYVPDPGQIPGWLARAADDRAAARMLLEEALNGGAGDNVALVTYGGDSP